MIRKIREDPNNLLQILGIQPGVTKKHVDAALIELYSVHYPRNNPQLAQVVSEACRRLEKTGLIRREEHNVEHATLIWGIDVGSHGFGCSIWLDQTARFLQSVLGGSSGKTLLSCYDRISGREFSEARGDFSNRGTVRVSRIIEDIHEVLCGHYPRDRMLEVLNSFFQGLKAHATEVYPNASNTAVISVPAAFSRRELALVFEAANKAGIKVTTFLSCSCAAAIVYAKAASIRKESEKLLIFDMGAGKLEISIVDCGRSGPSPEPVIVEILAVRSQIGAGINAMDEEVVRFLTREFESQNRPSLHLDIEALRRFSDAAEQIRMDISYTGSANLNLPYLASDALGVVGFEYCVSTEKYSTVISPILKKANELMSQLLQDARVGATEISRIVFVGGGSRLPAVRNLIEAAFPKSQITQTVDPIEAASQGACMVAAMKLGLDGTSMLVLDSAWHSLGVGIKDGIFVKMIEKNTTIPTLRSATFTTVRDNQATAAIPVYEGDDTRVSNDVFLGELVISDLLPQLHRLSEIKITFDLHLGGTLQVTAKETTTNKEVSIALDLERIGHTPVSASCATRLYPITTKGERPTIPPPAKPQPRSIERIEIPRKQIRGSRRKGVLGRILRRD